MAASPREVYDAIVGQPSSTDALLIDPGNPDTSELWRRLNRELSDPLYMPLGGTVLEEREYATIRAWIESGASY